MTLRNDFVKAPLSAKIRADQLKSQKLVVTSNGNDFYRYQNGFIHKEILPNKPQVTM